MKVIEIPEYQPKPIDPFAVNGTISYTRPHISDKPIHYENNNIQRLQDITVKPRTDDAPAVHSNVTINLHVHYKGTEYQSQPEQNNIPQQMYVSSYQTSPLSSLLGGHKYTQTAPAVHYIAQQSNPLYETKPQKDITYRYNTTLGNRCAYCTCHRKYQ